MKRIDIIILLFILIGITSCWEIHKEKQNADIIFYNQIKQYILNESTHVWNTEVYFGTDTLSTFNLLDSIKGNTLIFRFSGDMCNLCIDFVIKELKENFGEYYANKHIQLLSSNLNPRLKESYYGKKVLSLVSINMGIPYEKKGIPFLFILNENKELELMFIPDKRYPELTNFYLKTIKDRFINNCTINGQ